MHPRDHVVGIARAFTGFIAVNVLSIVLGLMFMPLPRTLVIALFFSCWWLFLDWKLWTVQGKALSEWLQERLKTNQPSINVAITAIFGIIFGIISLVSWKPLEGRLWATGAFGEAPDNRMVYIYAPEGAHVGTPIIAEFAVRREPLPTVAIGFSINQGQESFPNPSFDMWNGKPGRPFGTRFVSVPGQFLWTRDKFDHGLFSIHSNNRSVSKESSLYISFVSVSEDWHLRGCYFRATWEKSGHGCWESVRVQPIFDTERKVN